MNSPLCFSDKSPFSERHNTKEYDINTSTFYTTLKTSNDSYFDIYVYRLISFTNFNAQFFYSLTICMLYYNPRHVSSINMPIFRRTNFIITASGIVAPYKRLHSMPDESALIRHTVQPFIGSDDTRCCDNQICPPEDGHVNTRNMSRIVM
jgi:hypothetical protein